MILYIGGLGISELFILLLLFIIPFVLWLWALIDVLKSDFKDSSTKVMWLLVLVLIPVVGWILYFAIGRSQRLTI